MQGKISVITGAGRGIGRAIAQAYAAAGSKVVCAARSEDQLAETVTAITADGGQAIAVPTDVTDRTQVQRLFEEAEKTYGGVDIVVINAGGNTDRKLLEDGEIDDWIAVIELNLIGAYLTLKASLPHLRKRGAGKIITIGSGMGRRGAPGASSYAAAKAGLSLLTRVAAQELGETNITINELIPGPVRTALTAGVEERAKASGGATPFTNPVEWIKTPEDVVPLALFLANQPERGPTGQTFSLMRRDM